MSKREKFLESLLKTFYKHDFKRTSIREIGNDDTDEDCRLDKKEIGSAAIKIISRVIKDKGYFIRIEIIFIKPLHDPLNESLIRLLRSKLEKKKFKIHDVILEKEMQKRSPERIAEELIRTVIKYDDWWEKMTEPKYEIYKIMCRIVDML